MHIICIYKTFMHTHRKIGSKKPFCCCLLFKITYIPVQIFFFTFCRLLKNQFGIIIFALRVLYII